MSEICGTLTDNPNKTCRSTQGEMDGFLFSVRSLTALDPDSDLADTTTLQALMQADLDNGRLVKLLKQDAFEAGEPEEIEAESNQGNYKIDENPQTDTLTFYVSRCSRTSILGAFRDGKEGYIWRLTQKDYVQGIKDSSGHIRMIKAYISARPMNQSGTSPDRVEVKVTYRELWETNELSKKADFTLDDLESITEVVISNLVADDTEDTVVFDAKTCGGTAITDVTLANYNFTAGGSAITPSGITQSGSTITATFGAGEVTGTVAVTLDAPSTSAENYEITETYSVTAS